MMHGDLLKWLRDEPELTPLVGQFEGHSLIYWAGLPRGAEKISPGIVMAVVSVGYQNTQTGNDVNDLKSHRIQFDVHGLDPLDSQLAFDQLVKILSLGKPRGDSGRVIKGTTEFHASWPDGERGPQVQERQDGVDIFTTSGDFIIWHRPFVDGSNTD